MPCAISGARSAAPNTHGTGKNVHPKHSIIFSSWRNPKTQILFPAWLQWQICSYWLLTNIFILDLRTFYCLDFWNWEVTGYLLCPLHLRPGLATFLKALHQKTENRRSIQRYIPRGPSQPASAYSSGFPAPKGLSWSQLDLGNQLNRNGSSTSPPC